MQDGKKNVTNARVKFLSDGDRYTSQALQSGRRDSDRMVRHQDPTYDEALWQQASNQTTIKPAPDMDGEECSWGDRNAVRRRRKLPFLK